MGTRANSTDTCGFTSPPLSSPSIVRIDIDPVRAGGSYPEAIPLIGDVATVLKQMLDQAPVPEALDERRQLGAWIQEQRAMWEHPMPTSPASVDGCDPRSVFETIRDVAGDDCPLAADCGTATPYLGAYWTGRKPGRSLILARGHGPMGYAFPGAVGLALAHPNEPVIAIVTDGSLLMAVGALEPVAGSICR